jgi:transcriptional regulator with XRE-family HTH domain
MSAASLLSQARRTSSITATQAARLAGVAPSTVTRIERGDIDPSVSTLERILAACGWRYDGFLQPHVDLDAVRAARRIFEPEAGISGTVGSETYAARWGLANVTDAEDVAFSASRQALLSERPGAERFGFMEWRKVARSLRDSGNKWALTGGYAANAYTKVATSDWAVFYVDDVEEAASVAGLPPVRSGRTWTTLIPFDDVTAAGVQILESGLCLASFWQIVIDCFAGNGRMPAQAEAMLAKVVV